MNDLTPTVRTMDSREIAQLTNKNHGHICRDIQEMLSRLNGTDQSSFGSVYKAGNGEERRCYKLPYRETMILVSGYSVELRARVVDRWLELERESGKLPNQPRRNAEVSSQERKADLPKNGKLPSGAQLHELRLMAEKGKLDRNDLRFLLGLPLPEITQEARAPLAIAEAGFEGLRRIAEGGPAQPELGGL